MKHSKNIDELIGAFLSGMANEEDKKRLKEWRSSSPDHEIQLDTLSKVWRERSAEPKFINSEELADRIWQKGVLDDPMSRAKTLRQRSSNKIYLIKIAAAVAIFIIAPYLLYLFQGKTVTEDNVVSSIPLTFKSNPAGQKTRINLPDGSVVWLNSVSSITYPSYFSDTTRTLELIGEAYFEVKRDSLRPFKVKSGNLLTTALGTSFNISAYPEEGSIHIGLITGKVSVEDEQSRKSVILYPNYGVVYNKSDRNMREISIDPDAILAWKNGVLIFDGDDFQAFIDRLAKWYGVKIIVEGEPPLNWRIRGRFADEYLTNVLNSVSFNKDFSYEINRKEVVFTFK